MFTAGSSPEDEPEEIVDPEETQDPEETREWEAETTEEEPLDDEALEAVEEEEWEGDEYEDWEEDLDQPAPIGPATEGDRKNSGVEDFKVWFVAFRQRARTVWKRFWARIGAVKLPNHEIDGTKVLVVTGILAVAAMVGTGGYLLGKGSGDDVDQARLEGEFAGKREGAIEGATKGYAAGFKRGRDQAFRKSYSASYKRNYIRAYSKAGMDAPKPKDIEVPNP